MGDVIDMHSRQKQEKASEDRVAATARRASMLREALKAKSMFETDDQRRAAANFHALLEQFERERRLRKLDVAVRAGLCNHAEVESTKRLDTYTLPENATQKRINRLAKKVDK